MRRVSFLIAVLITPIFAGCDPSTDPDFVLPIAFAAIEGMAPHPDTTIIYSCGPGLFNGRTTSDSTGYYRISLGYPHSLKADLPSDRRLGCMVQAPYPTSYWFSLSVPTITFVARADDVQPVRADISDYYPRARSVHTTRDNKLFDLSVGETKEIPSLSPCVPKCRYFGIALHPEVAEATPGPLATSGRPIFITGLSAGTTTITFYGVYRNEYGTPDGWVIKEDTSLIGAIGVRVR